MDSSSSNLYCYLHMITKQFHLHQLLESIIRINTRRIPAALNLDEESGVHLLSEAECICNNDSERMG